MVYQILNTEKISEKDKKLVQDVRFKPTQTDVMMTWRHYRPAMLIEANDLDQVFEIGNIGPRHKVQKFTERAASVSVGDVICNIGESYPLQRCYVDSFGFSEISPSMTQLMFPISEPLFYRMS